MKSKFFASILFAQFFFCSLAFGQERGVINVAVKQSNGLKHQQILYRNSYALLIGNSAYSEWNSLPGVERDISQVEAVLRDKHGFRVEKALNLSKTELLGRIDQFISNYGQDYENRLLIYYAGHGYTAKLPDGRVMGYLVMKDAPIISPVEESLQKTPKNFSEFRLRAISMDDIEKSAKEITTRHALFVFDSCFSGTALYRDNSVQIPPEISSEELKQMRGFLTAGNEKQRVRDDSPFRRAFIKGLEGKADTNGDGYILSSELGAYVKREVYLEPRDTSLPQSPIFGKQTNFTRGDMVFVLPKANVPTPAQIAWNNFRGIAKNLMKYDEVFEFSEGFAKVKLKEKHGFINSKGIEIIPVIYDFASIFSEGFVLVGKKTTTDQQSKMKYGYLDQNGKITIPLKYDDAFNFNEGLARVVLNNRVGFIDKSEKTVIPFVYDYNENDYLYEIDTDYAGQTLNLFGFKGGVANVAKSGKCALINKNGKLLTSFDYDYISQFSDGVAVFQINEKWGLLNSGGKIVLNPKYDMAFSFSEGLALVGTGDSNNKLYGFIDKYGKEIISLRYSRVGSFHSGLVYIEVKNQLGFIDKTGKQIISPIYEHVHDFEEEAALAKFDGKFGLISKTGSEIFPFRFENEFGFGKNINYVWVENKGYELLDNKGFSITSSHYDDVWCDQFVKDGFIGIKSKDKKGFVDTYGNEYFDF